jgi:hypothetical protein
MYVSMMTLELGETSSFLNKGKLVIAYGVSGKRKVLELVH